MFFVYIKTALVAGLLLAAPYVFYQIYLLVAPGFIKRKGNHHSLCVVLHRAFCGRILFGYFVVFPYGFKFFLAFSNEYLRALPSVSKFFSLPSSCSLLSALSLSFL